MKDENNSSNLVDKDKSDVLALINILNTQIDKIQSQLYILNHSLDSQNTHNDIITRRLDSLEYTMVGNTTAITSLQESIETIEADLKYEIEVIEGDLKYEVDLTDSRINSIVLDTSALNIALSTQTDLIEKLHNENTKLHERMDTIQGYRTIKLT